MRLPTIYVLVLDDKYMSQAPFRHEVYLDPEKAKEAYDRAVEWGKSNAEDGGHGYQEVTLWLHDWETAAQPASELDKRTQEERYADGVVSMQWALE